MKKYLTIYKQFWGNAFSYQSMYRGSTWVEVLVLLCWLAILFLTIDVLFAYTNDIAGWTKQELYLMTLFWTLSYEFSTLFYRRSIDTLPDTITDGTLDMLLTKPVNEIFLITLKQVEIRSVFTIIVQLIIMGWLTFHYDFAVSNIHIFFAIVMLSCSILLQYSISLIANTCSFWLMRISNINDAIWSLRAAGKFPLDIYPATGRILFLTLLPVGYMAYAPVYVLTTIQPWMMLLLGICVTLLLFTSSIGFWNFAVKRYTSASS